MESDFKTDEVAFPLGTCVNFTGMLQNFLLTPGFWIKFLFSVPMLVLLFVVLFLFQFSLSQELLWVNVMICRHILKFHLSYQYQKINPWFKLLHKCPIFFLSWWNPRWLSGKELTCQCRRYTFHPWVGKIPCSRKWQPIPILMPGKSTDRGPWWATGSGVGKSQKRLNN